MSPQEQGKDAQKKNTLVQRKLGQIDPILSGSEQIHQLAHLRLERRLVEQLEQVHVIRLPTKMLLQ